MNNVVLGDLSLYDGVTTLMFNNVGFVSTSNARPDASCVFVPYSGNAGSGGIIGSTDNSIAVYFSETTGGGTVRVTKTPGEGGGFNYQSLPTFNFDVENTVSVGEDVTGKYVMANGVITYINIDSVDFNIDKIGQSSGNFFGEVLSFTIGEYSYIQNGDFGSANVPSTPAGNDGVLNSVVWWKLGIDEVFATPQLYKSSWPVMDDDQTVTYTDATPVYRAGNSFWEPYSTDGVFTFTLINGLVNNVILGDLSLYKGNDVLKFDSGINGNVNCGNDASLHINTNDTFLEITFSTRVTGGSSFGNCLMQKSSTPAPALGWYLSVKNNFVVYRPQGSTAEVDVGVNMSDGLKHTICLEQSGSTASISIDGIHRADILGCWETTNVLDDLLLGYFDNSVKFDGLISSVKYGKLSTPGVYALDINLSDQFGNATVIDSSPEGNDGTINGPVWWKEGIDEVFADPATYKATWVDPMEESQLVTYSDDTNILYKTNDVFWNDYNIDVTFSFKVKTSQFNFIKWLLELEHGDIDMVRKSIKGSTLGTGIVDMPQRSYPSYILANSDGTLRVRYANDTTFTDITVISDGTMYPVGLIAQIDVTGSTVTIADVVLGIQ